MTEVSPTAVILLHLPLPLVGVSIGMERGVQHLRRDHVREATLEQHLHTARRKAVS